MEWVARVPGVPQQECLEVWVDRGLPRETLGSRYVGRY